MSRRGRPPVLDAVKRREICAILTAGGSRALAARYVGCARSTIGATAVRDLEFHRQLQRASVQHEIMNLRNIQSAAKNEKYWRAAAWTLERCYPDRYGQRSATTVTAENVSQLLGKVAELLVEEIPDRNTRRRILERLDRLTADLHEGEQGRA